MLHVRQNIPEINTAYSEVVLFSLCPYFVVALHWILQQDELHKYGQSQH